MPVSEEEYRDHMRSHHAFMNRLAEDDDEEETEEETEDDDDDEEEGRSTTKRKATPPPRKRKAAGKTGKAAKSRPSSYGNPRWFGHG
jgi:fatty acid desaturase